MFTAPEFQRPIRLKAGGEYIDTGLSLGHASPWVADAHGDGREDLVVGDFCGKFRIFRNTGTNVNPHYEPAGYLQAGGVDAEVWTY